MLPASSKKSLLQSAVSAALLAASGGASATDYETLFSGIFSNSSNSASEQCTQCHTTSSPNTTCGTAPDMSTANYAFWTTSTAIIDDDTVSPDGFGYVKPGDSYMPLNPSTCSSTVGVGELQSSDVNQFLAWDTAGRPLGTPTAVTDNAASSISKTGATLRGDFNTNVHAATTVPGTYYFDYGLTTGYGSTTSAGTLSSTTQSNNLTRTISSGLSCGTTYNYRARATNGAHTGGSAAAGVNRTFETSYCTTPSLTAIGGPFQPDEGDSFIDITIRLTDPDPGTITWSIDSQGSKGSAAVIGGSTTSTPQTNFDKTIRYTLNDTDVFGSDSFVVMVDSNKSGEDGGADDNDVQSITVNIDIQAQPDPPVISVSGTTISLNEDNSASTDATTSAATVSGSVSLSASDPDASPTYHWDVTASNDGTPAFTVATGSSPTLTYTPQQDDFGAPADSFTVRVCDGGSAGVGNCDTQAFSVNLTARPDSPDAVADTGLVVVEGAASTLLSVVGNDSDTDGDNLVPFNVMVTGGIGLTVNGISGNQIDVAHNGAEESTAQLTYQARDDSGLMLTSNTVTVDINISGTDDPPTSSNFTHGSTINEGSSGNVINVIAQSNDPEGATMAVCTSGPLALGGATYGSLSVNGDGNVVYDHDGTDVDGPPADEDTFTYAVNDANDATCTTGNNSTSSTVTVNLAFVNDRPVAVNDAFTVAEGGTFDMTASGVLDTGPGNTSLFDNDTDEENNALQLGSNGAASNSASLSVNSSGQVIYTHNAGETTSDSFTYVVNDGSIDSSNSGTVSITVTPVNDAPVITEDADTVTVFEEDAASAYNDTFTATDVDIVSGNDALTWSITSGQSGDMNIVPGTGQLTWTPERTGTFNDTSRSVTIRVTDDDKSTAGSNPLFDEYTFIIRTSPPDFDMDGIPDYVDNCERTANPDQADLDMDTVAIGGASLITSSTPASLAGYPNLDVDHAATDPANALGESYKKGGDACDEDVDGDGISKAFEDSLPFLSDTDPSDAAKDKDGDSVSNLDEFLAGTDLEVDSVGPSITAPADVTVDATGYLTAVDVGEAVAIDGNEGAVLTVKAAVDANPPIDINTDTCDILDDWDETVPALRPGEHKITWITCDRQGNLAKSTDQTVIVRPLASVTNGQNVGEGQAAQVKVSLNGASASYPVSINYSVGGFANPASDHDAVNGVITVSDPDVDGNTPGTVGRLTVNIANDSETESDETVLIQLDAADHAAISTANLHTITIVGSNVAPQVSIDVTQNAVAMGSVIFATASAALDGDVVLTADSFDANGDTLSYSWSDGDGAVDIATSGSSSQLLTISAAARAALAAGVYPLTVAVSDGNLSTTASINLVVAAAEPGLGSVDSDGDGTNDDVEGAGDADADGIPDYLDNDQLPSNVVQNQTANQETSLFLETELGLNIGIGTAAKASSAMGATVTSTALESFGGAGGGPGTNTDDEFTFLGGIFNFEVSGLTEAQTSVNVVIPLPTATLPNAEYRKYDGDGWRSFVVNAQNSVSSAAGEPGVCPAPGSTDYAAGIGIFHYCIQLTIEDGGPNDADGVRDFVIRDPGAVGIPNASDSTTASADERLGGLNPLSLMLLLPVLAYFAYRRRRQ